MERILDEPGERHRTGDDEDQRKTVLNHRRYVAAARRRLLARDFWRGSRLGLSVVRRCLGAAELRGVGTMNQGVDRNQILRRQPELLILRPGDLGDNEVIAPPDLHIGSSFRGRRPLNEQALGRDVTDADVEPAGVLLQTRGNQHLPAKMPSLVDLRC